MDPICALTILPDGKRIVSGASFGAVTVWDVEKVNELLGKLNPEKGLAGPFAGFGAYTRLRRQDNL